MQIQIFFCSSHTSKTNNSTQQAMLRKTFQTSLLLCSITALYAPKGASPSSENVHRRMAARQNAFIGTQENSAKITALSIQITRLNEAIENLASEINITKIKYHFKPIVTLTDKARDQLQHDELLLKVYQNHCRRLTAKLKSIIDFEEQLGDLEGQWPSSPRFKTLMAAFEGKSE